MFPVYLSTLNLKNNNLNILPSQIFRRLSHLETLTLSDNLLTRLPEDIFQSIQNLVTLKLDNNNLAELPNDIFRGLSSLKELAIDNNCLSHLPTGVFHGITTLLTLTLSNNNLTELPNGIFQGLSSLDVLTLNDNHFSEIPKEILKGLTSIQTLTVSDNDILKVPYRVCKKIPNIKTLNLSSNNLQILGEQLADCEYLESIDLRQNKLTWISNYAFNKANRSLLVYVDRISLCCFLPALRCVTQFSDLHNATLSEGDKPRQQYQDNTTCLEISPKMIKCTSVRQPYSVGNAINATICSIDCPVRCVCRLEYYQVIRICPEGISTLSLSYTHLKVIQHLHVTGIIQYPFAGLSTNLTDIISLQFIVTQKFGLLPEDLYTLDLSRNTLGELPKLAFNEFPSLMTLILEDTNITVLTREIFSGLNSIEILSLKTNLLTNLSGMLFQDIPSLLSLDLSNNNIHELSPGIFQGLYSLEILSLNDNHLSYILINTFRDIPSLRTLELSRNRFRKLSTGMFHGLLSLTTLTLSNNHLINLTAYVFEDIPSLITRNSTVIGSMNYQLQHFRGSYY